MKKVFVFAAALLLAGCNDTPPASGGGGGGGMPDDCDTQNGTCPDEVEE